MTENFKQNYISTVAAALVAALPTRTSTKPARNRGTTPKEVAASFNMEYDEDEDEGPIDTIKNKNKNGAQWLKVTDTNILPARWAGE
jgi:hypothetical protein